MFVGANEFPIGAPGTVYDPETGSFVSAPLAPGVTADIPMSITVTPPVSYYPPASVPVTPPVQFTPAQQRSLIRAGVNPITGGALARPLSAASLQAMMPWLALGGAGVLIYMMLSKRRRA